MSVDDIKADIEKYLPLISGLTLSGGDPVYQINDTVELATWAKENGLTVTLYTGFELRQIQLPNPSPFDFIIDGCFDFEKQSADCAFRGSSNQKVWMKLVDTNYTNIAGGLDYVKRKCLRFY